MSACFGLTQGDLESEYNTPFLSSSCISMLFFCPFDLRLTCACVVIGTTRYLCRRSLSFIILLYRRLLWRIGDTVKKIPSTLYHRLIPGEHDQMTTSRTSLYFKPNGITVNTKCPYIYARCGTYVCEPIILSLSFKLVQARTNNTVALLVCSRVTSAYVRG